MFLTQIFLSFMLNVLESVKKYNFDIFYTFPNLHLSPS